MRNRALLFLILITILFSCQKKNKYPEEIVTNKLESEFDDAKWFLYCLYSDSKCINIRTGNSVTDIVNTNQKFLSSEELVFDGLTHKSDTFYLNFKFKIGNSCYCSKVNKNDYILAEGMVDRVVVVKGIKKPVFYGLIDYENTFMQFYPKSKKDRFNDVLQPEVITFLNNSKPLLNEWLREEGIKRGVIK